MTNWSKKVHVKSSLERKKVQYSLFVGRWQPLHEGHKQMFQQVLDEGGNVCIAIRDVEVSINNPFSSYEVMKNIMNEYEEHIKNNRVRVMVIPDICSIEFGRGVGYDIIERIPPEDISKISATEIRKNLKYGNKY